MSKRWLWLLTIPVAVVIGSVACATVDINGDVHLAPVAAEVMPSVPGAQVLSSRGFEGLGCCENPPGRREVQLQVEADKSGDAVSLITQAFEDADWVDTGCTRWAEQDGKDCLMTTGYTAVVSPAGAGSSDHSFLGRCRDRTHPWVTVMRGPAQKRPIRA